MLRERLEAIQLLDYTIFILFAYVWLIDSSELLLLLRVFTQIQICSPATVHPFFTLPAFALLIVWTTSIFVFSHAWWDWGRIDNPTLLIDFIGRDHHVSRLQLICLDLLIAFLQLLLVTLAFETQKRPAETTDPAADDGSIGTTTFGVLGRPAPSYASLDAASDGEDAEPSDNDDERPRPDGQGWDAQDEEAGLLSATERMSRRRDSRALNRSSLTHPIAVFRPGQLLRDMWGAFTRPAGPRSTAASGAPVNLPVSPSAAPAHASDPQLRIRRTTEARRARSGNAWLNDARQQMARFAAPELTRSSANVTTAAPNPHQ